MYARGLTPSYCLNIIYHMSLWNKILIGLICVASLGFFYTAARTLRTYQYWGDKASRLEKLLVAQKEVNRRLLEADADSPLEDKTVGILASQSELHRLLINRGRVWDKCDPQKVDPKTQSVSVNTDPGVPNHITDKLILYAFEDSENKSGRYIGEFRVTAVAENSVVLTPTLTLGGEDLKRLSIKGPWLLYELMPYDWHGVFAELTDDERKTMLPESTLKEYVKDGQPAESDDPKDCKVDGKYRRHLRDYKQIFRTCETERILFDDMFEVVSRDLAFMEGARDDAQKQLKFAEQGAAVMKADLVQSQKEQKAVRKHMATLEWMLNRLLKGEKDEKGVVMFRGVEDFIQSNLAIAAEIAQMQLEAAKRIDERTHRMAAFGPGAN